MTEGANVDRIGVLVGPEGLEPPTHGLKALSATPETRVLTAFQAARVLCNVFSTAFFRRTGRALRRISS